MTHLSGGIQNVQGSPPAPVYDSTAASTNGLPTPIFEYIDPYTVKVLAGGSLFKIAEFESKSGNIISAEDLRIFNSIVDPTKLGINSVVLVPKRVGDSLRMQFDNVAYSIDRRTGEYEFSTLDAQSNTVRWQRTIVAGGAYEDRYVVTSGGDGSIIRQYFTPVADVYGVNFQTLNPANLVNISTTTTPAPTLPGAPDPTNGINTVNNTLIANGDFIVTGVGNVNNDGGSTAKANNIVAEFIPGNHQNVFDAFGNTPLDSGFDASTAYGASQIGSIINHNASGLTALIPTDPLVLDLNGDGVKLTNFTDAPVLFDADNDGGSLEQTGWVSNEDGIVVHDLNNDGKINNISETLSEYYNGVAGSNGVNGTKPFANGFAALKSLDSNNDNQFTSTDAAWSQLKVWQDSNHDGKTDAGELKTFADLGITAINLSSTSQSGEVRDGNAVLARGTFTQNGITREAIAANFLANPASSTITQANGGAIFATINIADGSCNTGAITAFFSQNTVSIVYEALDAAALNVRHLTGGAGADTLTGDEQNNWLAGGRLPPAVSDKDMVIL